MKSILYFSFVLTLNGLFAQGNLQFNQVINWKIPTQTVWCNIGFAGPAFSGNLTIPANKVWRIETSSLGGDSYGFWSLYLDNYLLFTFQTSANGTPLYRDQRIRFPIWLPSGTYQYRVMYGGACNNANLTFDGSSTSIVEFNVIP